MNQTENPKVIVPTVGRIVWYYPSQYDGLPATPGEPLAAVVVKVWGDRMVNLAVYDHNGNPHARTSVKLVQPGDDSPPDTEQYCRWMPYQIQTAQK